MSSLSILFLLAMSSSPTPGEVADDLASHPWRPAPAGAMGAETTSRTVSPSQQVPATAVSRAPAAAAASPAGIWQLQLGALANPDAANAEKKRIEKVLGTGAVEIFADGGVNKLRYGRFGTREEAETARSGLKAKGIDGFAALRP